MVPRIKIAFDVDQTLITQGENGRNVPNYEVIATYKWFEKRGCVMIIWSGSGMDYAKTWAENLGLKPNVVMAKPIGQNNIADIAFDDQDVDLATVNININENSQ